MTISCSYKSKVVYCPYVERELHYDIQVDTLSFWIVQKRLMDALDGAASVFNFTPMYVSTTRGLRSVRVVNYFGSLRVVFESFGSIIVDNGGFKFAQSIYNVLGEKSV